MKNLSTIIRAACIQLNSGQDIQENLRKAGQYIKDAAGKGANLIATPEVTDQVISNRADHMEETYKEAEHPAIAFGTELAGALNIHLLLGSICVKKENGKIANRSYVFGPDGRIRAQYDKIHLFDVDLPTGESHRESKVFDAGQGAVITDLNAENTSTKKKPEAGEIPRLGLSICYDIRFASLYRSLAKGGANIISVPAAFTVPTGQAHWKILLRARAIETGSFILAPAQWGDHGGARKTYGHSMIIGPWGDILACKEDREGIITVDLDLDECKKARHSIPSLNHDRPFSGP